MTNHNQDKIVISLYDYTGEALKPWAMAGYQCHAFDIQHENKVTETFEGGGTIKYRYADLHDISSLDDIFNFFHNKEVTFAMAFPVCTDLAVSGAAHFKRKPDYSFHPFEYGGYIEPDQAEHPKWPDYIAPMDAYPKKTCLWTGGYFTMPDKSPVEPETGHSRQHLKLGGKSMKTKNIRSATPRGFAQAVFNANNSSMQSLRYHKRLYEACVIPNETT